MKTHDNIINCLRLLDITGNNEETGKTGLITKHYTSSKWSPFLANTTESFPESFYSY